MFQVFVIVPGILIYIGLAVVVARFCAVNRRWEDVVRRVLDSDRQDEGSDSDVDETHD